MATGWRTWSASSPCPAWARHPGARTPRSPPRGAPSPGWPSAARRPSPARSIAALAIEAQRPMPAPAPVATATIEGPPERPRLARFPNWHGVIGTDPARAAAFTPALSRYVADSPYKTAIDARRTGEYAAPPLSGVWASAPYLHNGSVPTLAQLMLLEPRSERFEVGGHSLDFKAVGIAGEDRRRLSGRLQPLVPPSGLRHPSARPVQSRPRGAVRRPLDRRPLGADRVPKAPLGPKDQAFHRQAWLGRQAPRGRQAQAEGGDQPRSGQAVFGLQARRSGLIIGQHRHRRGRQPGLGEGQPHAVRSAGPSRTAARRPAGGTAPPR
jgi:hypothetical protein